MIGKVETSTTKKKIVKNNHIQEDKFDKLFQAVESDLLLYLLEKKASIDYKNGKYDTKDWGE